MQHVVSPMFERVETECDVSLGRARINAIKDKSFDEDDDAAAATVNRKKLSDVKVRALGLCML